MNRDHWCIILHTVPCGPLATKVAASFFMALAFKNKILPMAFPPSTGNKRTEKEASYENTNLRNYFGVGDDHKPRGAI